MIHLPPPFLPPPSLPLPSPSPLLPHTQAVGSSSSETKRTKSQSSDGGAPDLPNVLDYYKSNTVSAPKATP